MRLGDFCLMQGDHSESFEHRFIVVLKATFVHTVNLVFGSSRYSVMLTITRGLTIRKRDHGFIRDGALGSHSRCFLLVLSHFV